MILWRHTYNKTVKTSLVRCTARWTFRASKDRTVFANIGQNLLKNLDFAFVLEWSLDIFLLCYIVQKLIESCPKVQAVSFQTGNYRNKYFAGNILCLELIETKEQLLLISVLFIFHKVEIHNLKVVKMYTLNTKTTIHLV